MGFWELGVEEAREGGRRGEGGRGGEGREGRGGGRGKEGMGETFSDK